MKSEKHKNLPNPQADNEAEITPGYPVYPASEDIYNNSEKDFSVRRIICEILLRKNFTVLREGCYKQILDENIQFIEEIDKIKYIEVCKLCGEAPKNAALRYFRIRYGPKSA